MPTVNIDTFTRSADKDTSYQGVYIVEFTEAEVADLEHNPILVEAAAYGASGLPAKGSYLASNAAAKLVSKSTSIVSRYNLWQVTCNWTTSRTVQLQTQTDPLDIPVGINRAAAPMTIELSEDYSSTPKLMQNTAGDWLDPPVTVEVYPEHIVITKNISDDPDGYFDLLGHFNDDEVSLDGGTFAAKTLLCKDARAEKLYYYDEETEAEVAYNSLQVTLAKADGDAIADWESVKRYSVGYRYKDGSGNILPILDDAEQPVVAPYPLTSSGGKAASADTEPYEMTFVVRTEADFSPIESLLS